MRGGRAARRPGLGALGSRPSTSSGVRDWVLAFNAAGPEGLIDGKAPGKVPLLNAEQCAALRRIVEAGPNPAVDGVVRWRLIDLAQWVYAEFGISISKQTLSRMLRAMGYRKLSARPRHHAQDPAALAAFKKNFVGCVAEIAHHEAAGQPIEVWFADEARIGQKNKITRPLRQAQEGQTRHPAFGATRSAHRLSLHFWRDLSPRGQRRSPGSATLQHRSDEPASGRDRPSGSAGSARRAHARSGGMAPVGQARRAIQHHPLAIAAQMPGVEPGREPLAGLARQLALQPGVPLIPRHPRPLLPCLEQARRPALDHHVDRPPRLGSWVLINGIWYKVDSRSSAPLPKILKLFRLRKTRSNLC